MTEVKAWHQNTVKNYKNNLYIMTSGQWSDRENIAILDDTIERERFIRDYNAIINKYKDPFEDHDIDACQITPYITKKTVSDYFVKLKKEHYRKFLRNQFKWKDSYNLSVNPNGAKDYYNDLDKFMKLHGETLSPRHDYAEN
jgi:hypothetical protein